MASLTSAQRIILGIGVIAFAMLGIFAPWDRLSYERVIMFMDDTAITEWPIDPAGRYLIFFPPKAGGLRIAVDPLTVEWLIVVVLSIGSVLILKQNQTSRF